MWYSMGTRLYKTVQKKVGEKLDQRQMNYVVNLSNVF